MIDATKKRMYTKKKLLAESAMRIAGGGGSEIRSWHESSSNSNLKVSSMFPSMLMSQYGGGRHGSGKHQNRAIAAGQHRSLPCSTGLTPSSSSPAIATLTTHSLCTTPAPLYTLPHFTVAEFALLSTLP
eukprot:TRINITY_DN9987_c0_g1_i1.p1 TRINITY_DN9987_c0_g1~~TRINITY_DN9987_c0_g1_i1.p1  ORF type:complete len:129 (-),score=28.84 TRINITY_DN9987_c0_g1_i1:6-392(-)